MLRGSEPPESPPDADLEELADEAVLPDLSAMPIAGLTRGRLLLLAGLFAAAWIVFAFWRQVGTAGELTQRADALRIGNANLEARVAELQAELELIQRPEYVALQARGYRLGRTGEIPFTLDPNAPPLGPDAPGSAATAVGAGTTHRAPLEAWLTLLFAPTD
jgi:cell division protein FtsB